MLRQVFIAGATGYTGRILVELIVKSLDWKAIAQVRPGSPRGKLLPPAVERREVDLTNLAALTSALTGCEAVVSLVGTTRAQFGPGISYETVDIGTTQTLVTAAQQGAVKRFVLVSSIGASETGVAYLRAKAAAERIVRQSGLSYVILRPSAIVGPNRQWPRIAVPIAAVLRYVPALQKFVDDYRPVHVKTLARAIFEAVKLPGGAEEIWSGRAIWDRKIEV